MNTATMKLRNRDDRGWSADVEVVSQDGDRMVVAPLGDPAAGWNLELVDGVWQTTGGGSYVLVFGV